ncbi:MAG: hypothetical protein IPK77_02885 [Cellvibrio sp.]|nr:hypothetical protein [Cellvibrio sp.]
MRWSFYLLKFYVPVGIFGFCCAILLTSWQEWGLFGAYPSSNDMEAKIKTVMNYIDKNPNANKDPDVGVVKSFYRGTSMFDRNNRQLK